MKRSAFAFLAVFALAAVVGCSESASVDSDDLSNAEAAAMVAPETEKSKETSEIIEKSDAEAAAVEATAVAFNVEGAPTVDFSVPDMMCEHSCVPAVRETLAALPGVKDVKVDLASKTATVAVDKDQFNADAAVAALVDRMFSETKVLGVPAEKADN